MDGSQRPTSLNPKQSRTGLNSPVEYKGPDDMKDWVIQEQESVCKRFAGGNLERKEAVQMLMRLGFDGHEADVLLTEAIS